MDSYWVKNTQSTEDDLAFKDAMTFLRLALDCMTREVRKGLASTFHVSCSGCEEATKVNTSKFRVPEGKHSTAVVHDLDIKAVAGNKNT